MEEIQEDVQMLPEVSYQILNVDHLLLRNLEGNFTQEAQSQSFMITGLSGVPAINISYGPMSLERVIPLSLMETRSEFRASVLRRQVRQSSPVIRILFYSTGETTSTVRLRKIRSGPKESGYTCIIAHAYWRSTEIKKIRGTCSIRAGSGFCLAELRPEASWFSPGNPRSSQENRTAPRKSTVELYYHTRASSTDQCDPQESQQVGGADAVRSELLRIGDVTLLRSPPGNPALMRLRLGGILMVQTSSKPLKMIDTATFYVFLTSTSNVESFILR